MNHRSDDLSAPYETAHGPRELAVGIGCYHFGVPVQKVSISLDEQVLAAARQAAERRSMSLSAWLNDVSERALETEASLEDGLAAVAEWEAESGPITPQELAEADAILDAAGVGRRREPRRAA
jgi:hypothetical protein